MCDLFYFFPSFDDLVYSNLIPRREAESLRKGHQDTETVMRKRKKEISASVPSSAPLS